MPCPACSLRTAMLAAVVPLALLGSIGLIGGWAVADRAGAEPAVGEEEQVTPFVLDHRFDLIDGKQTSLSAYRGRVIMLVNTASRCGLTPQYEALEKLYRQHEKDGLVVIGFPANDFMGQEPGTNEEIQTFCSENYGVTFPMAAKVSVKGDDAHPLYRHLAKLPEPLGGEPGWNFTKFLVDREGNVVARFEPRVRPDDERVISEVRRLLGAPEEKEG